MIEPETLSSPATILTNEIDDVEMMDTSEAIDEPSSSYLNVFNFTNSPMSVGSPSVPSTAGGFSSGGIAPGSPQVSFGGKGKSSRVRFE